MSCRIRASISYPEKLPPALTCRKKATPVPTVFIMLGMLAASLGGGMETTSAAAAAAPQEISITAIDGLRIGNAQDTEAKTGVTALVFPRGARAGVDISGGGPASRETPVLSPTTAATPVNAIVLAGGSAYGLEAGSGAMRYLEEQGIGYDTGFALVPIVCQSDIYDLSYGSASVRPDGAMAEKLTVEAPAEQMDAILAQAEKIIHRLEPDVRIQA